MKRVHILVEGQTEETVVRELLAPHLQRFAIFPTPKLCVTGRVKSGVQFKGGLVSYGKARNDLIRLLGDSSAVAVTTMLDYYALPADFPGHAQRPAASCFRRVEFLEDKFAEDIGHRNFIPYLMLHEYEALLFAQPAQIAAAFPDQNVGKHLAAVRSAYQSPEEINERPDSHPSAHINRLIRGYEKPFHGALIALDITLATIRQECSHFDSWVRRLEAL
jgi:hypothetical protein